MATAYVHGLQGEHPRYIRASAGCKHFAVYAGPENIPVPRESFDVKVSFVTVQVLSLLIILCICSLLSVCYQCHDTSG